MTDISFELRPVEPLLIVVSGPSGVGKDSVIQAMKRRKLAIHFVVTATNRAPRSSEVNGVDYIFVSTERFEEMIRNGELIEHALVYGDYKGIPQSQIQDALASGKDVILRIDVQGAATIRSIYPQAVMIFLVPANQQEWCKRLEDRHTDTHESIERRVATAEKELLRLPEFDYVVVNADDQLDAAVDQIVAIITAEHCRTEQRKIVR